MSSSSWLGGILGRILDGILNLQASVDALRIEQVTMNEQIKLLRDDLNNAVKDETSALAKILSVLEPPPPFGFKAFLTQGENMSAAKAKTAGVNASLTVNDDGTINLNVVLTDEDGLDITNLTSWPSQVAAPTAAFGDASPGPSSAVFIPNASPSPSQSVTGAFVVGVITAATPPSPLPAGWGQDVDVQVSIASGLTGQTSPVTEDAGTFSWQADSSKPSGFSASLTD